MPTLHVRNIPEELYSKLYGLAEDKNRSISAEVVDLLAMAIEEQQIPHYRKKVLGQLRRNRFSPRANTPSSTELLREDRSR
ncbi:MAG TPA: hypothetical protein PLI09_28935 [Candidatus Hydrogenedentes bacterium]|nr:hypothetical protein [Candidatus Hydrogenedentota bacterium]